MPENIRKKGDDNMTDMIDKEIAAEDDTLKDRYLTFSAGHEIYGLEIKYVTEIVGIQKITVVPEMPEYIKGIMNLRGKIIPVIDIRLRFKKEPKEYNDRTCIIVIDINGTSIGLIVDAVSEVVTIPEQDITDPPKINNNFKGRFIKKIGKVGNEVIMILDCEKIISEDELREINNEL
jgi:CheW-like domain.